MAKPLPNEKELYEKIKNEEIKVSAQLWSMLDGGIGDALTLINLICQERLAHNEPVPVDEVWKIQLYAGNITELIKIMVLTYKTKEYPFPKFKEDTALHPIIIDLLTHHLGNDVYMINLTIEDAQTDPLRSQPLPQKGAKKILQQTRSIKEFMDRLREVTLR